MSDAQNTMEQLSTMLSFRFQAMPICEADVPFTSQVEVLLGGVHETNHDHASNRLCQEIKGILSCRFMSDEDGHVKLTFDKRSLDRFTLLSAIQQLGYPVQLIDSNSKRKAEEARVEIRVEGMHCSSCVSNICGAVTDLPGAIDIHLTFDDKLATVTYDPRVLKIADIVKEIESLGFKTAIANSNQVQGTESLSVLESNPREQKAKGETIEPCIL